MYFYDQSTITITAGAGGKGCVSARRESGVPYGGPSGGNGGRGGSVWFRACKDLATLEDYKHVKAFKANDGEPGRSKDQYGADAADLTLLVPVGTIIKDITTGHILVELLGDGQIYCALQGGNGGVGNMHFKNAINQYPNFGLLGEPSRAKDVVLELQLLADVGLIGTPSVGKSTLINTIANTKAQVAAYHFTTLTPNLGVVQVQNRKPKVESAKVKKKVGEDTSPSVVGLLTSYTVIDIPGLIAGASQGKGLGNQFLRHVLKARAFALVVDISRYEQSFVELTTVVDEVLTYISQKFVGSSDFGSKIVKVRTRFEMPILTVHARDEDGQEFVLFTKAIHIVINKIDLVMDAEIMQEYKKQLLTHIAAYIRKKFHAHCTAAALDAHTFLVSAGTGQGLASWVHYCAGIMYGEQKELSTEATLATVYKMPNLPGRNPHNRQRHGTVLDVTTTELPYLLAHEYLDETMADRVKVWEVTDAEVCRLTFILPRGNDEAEHWYRKILDKQGWIKKFTQAGVLYGDVLKVVSLYEGSEDKYIEYKR